ncbi:choice-of-anchor B family protein [Aurantibacillus circumpalustris]|uniref:choice-of-anchor B family protein n=1 Tax=Aurantibacillus circumpalustris TaxID=3036359 RepID=UPI00295BFC93|nr:choice-of-anchor B family protein [Aurantibacillus circumpalustris]
MKLRHIFLILVIFLSLKQYAQTYAASNFTLIGLSNPETTFNPDSQKYSGCWGWYQASKNKEYAVACSHKGTYWIDISNPSTPTVSAYRAGKKSGCTWREAKSYRNYLYVISDDFGNNSFQIFDMQYLPDSVHKVYDGQTLFARAHTLYINQDKLYIGSATLGSSFSSMRVYSLANPTNPTLIRRLEQDYPLINHVHDMMVRNDTVYASCGNQGLYIYKLLANNTFTLLGSLTNYPFAGYNHSSALTPNGQTLVFMDEVPSGLPIKVANVSNFSNIQVLATINQFTNTTPHNPFMVSNQYCFASSYQDGLQLFDIANPSSPFLAGYFDTHPQSGGNNNTWLTGDEYNGQWGAYPYFPSGTIFALDRLNGAFFLNTSLYQTPLVSASLSAKDTVCVGATLDQINNSTGANTFTWTFPTGAVVSQTLGNASISFTSAGVYTVNLIASNTSFSSSVTKTITVINNNLNATINSYNASCSSCNTGSIIVVTVNGNSPFIYNWHPQAPNSATISNLAPGCYTVDIVDRLGCATSTNACVSFNSTVGLSSLKNNSDLLIYPNPASTYLYFVYPNSKEVTLELKNILGEIVLQKRVQGIAPNQIDIRHLVNGSYFISILENESIQNKKIIIQH